MIKELLEFNPKIKVKIKNIYGIKNHFPNVKEKEIEKHFELLVFQTLFKTLIDIEMGRLESEMMINDILDKVKTNEQK